MSEQFSFDVRQLAQRLLALSRSEMGLLWIDEHPECWTEDFVRLLLSDGKSLALTWAHYVSDRHLPVLAPMCAIAVARQLSEARKYGDACAVLERELARQTPRCSPLQTAKLLEALGHAQMQAKRLAEARASYGRAATLFKEADARCEYWTTLFAEVRVRRMLDANEDIRADLQRCVAGLEEAGAAQEVIGVAHACLADVLHTGDPQQALLHLRRALESAPDEFRLQLLTQSAACHVELHDPEAALACLEQCATIDPRDASTQRNLAYLYRSLDRLEEAKRHFEALIELVPGEEEFHHDLSEIHFFEKNEKEAIAVLRRGVECCPRSTRLLYSLSYLYATRDVGIANRLLEQAIAIDPCYTEGYLTLVANLLTIGEFESGRELLDRCEAKCELDPRQLTKLQDLRSRLQQLIGEEPAPGATHPDNASLQEDIRELNRLYARKDFAHLLERSRELQREFPNAFELRLAEADALSKVGREDEARPLAETLFQEHPENPQVIYLLTSLLPAEERGRMYNPLLASLDSEFAPLGSYLFAMIAAFEQEDATGANRAADCLRRLHPEALAQPEVQSALAMVADLKEDRGEFVNITDRLPENHDLQFLLRVGRLDACLKDDHREQAVAECDWLIERARGRADPPGGFSEESFLETRAQLLQSLNRPLDALPSWERLTELNPTADTFCDLAGCYLLLGNAAKAYAAYLEGLRLDPKSGRPYFALGELHHHAGHVDQAFLHWQHAAAQYEQAGDKDGLARVTQNLATLWQCFGEDNVARQFYERARALFLDLDLQTDATWVAEELAKMTLRDGDAAAGRQQLEACAARYRELGEEQHRANCLLTLVNFCDPVTEIDTVVRLVQEAIETYRASDRFDIVMGAQLLLGMRYRLAGMHRKAIETTEDALIRARVLVNRDQYLGQIHVELAEAHRATGDIAAAEKHFTEGLAWYKRNYERQAGEQARGHKFSLYAGGVYAYAAFLADRGRTRDAFELLDGTKSCLVSEHLKRGKRSPEESRDLGQLEAKRDELFAALTRTADAEEHRQLQSMIEALESAMAQVRALAASTRNQEGDGESPGRVSLTNLCEQLGGAVQVVEYLIHGEEVYAFIFRPHGGTVSTQRLLVGARELSELVRAYRSQVTRRVGQGAEARLADKLLGPLDGQLERDVALYIVPHQELHQIPFHALPFEGCYLGDEFLVGYAPSAAILGIAKGRTTEGKGCAVFGDPELQSEELALHYARTEAYSLEEILAGELRVGTAVTCAAVREAMIRCRVVHLACHGLFDQEHPLSSGLLLSDGRFSAEQILAIDGCPDLVALSACETSLGTIRWGDEVIGLTRSLFIMGARSILATLWPIDDLSTALFMRAFYRTYIGESGGKLNAMQQAWRAVREIKASEVVDFLRGSAERLGRAGEKKARDRAVDDLGCLLVSLGRYDEAEQLLLPAERGENSVLDAEVSAARLRCLEVLLEWKGMSHQREALKQRPVPRSSAMREVSISATEQWRVRPQNGVLRENDRLFHNPYYWAPFQMIGAW